MPKLGMFFVVIFLENVHYFSISMKVTFFPVKGRSEVIFRLAGIIAERGCQKSHLAGHQEFNSSTVDNDSIFH